MKMLHVQELPLTWLLNVTPPTAGAVSFYLKFKHGNKIFELRMHIL